MARAASRLFLTAETRVRAQVSLCEGSGGQSLTGTGFSPSSSVFPCQYHSPLIIHSLIAGLGKGLVRVAVQYVIFKQVTGYCRIWGSSVSIVPDYRLGDRGSIPGRGKGFFLYPLCPDQL
jgi:hypothetical protein